MVTGDERRILNFPQFGSISTLLMVWEQIGDSGAILVLRGGSDGGQC